MKYLLCAFVIVCTGCSSNNVSDQAVDQKMNSAVAKQDDSNSLDSPNNDNEIVCRRVAVTGSNLSKRVCQTRGQLKEERRIAQENAREERGNVNTNVGE